ncbi:MAG: hypothetical protein ACTSRP_11815 [Candidatus Helarchaeota archaeon]
MINTLSCIDDIFIDELIQQNIKYQNEIKNWSSRSKTILNIELLRFKIQYLAHIIDCYLLKKKYNIKDSRLDQLHKDYQLHYKEIEKGDFRFDIFFEDIQEVILESELKNIEKWAEFGYYYAWELGFEYYQEKFKSLLTKIGSLDPLEDKEHKISCLNEYINAIKQKNSSKEISKYYNNNKNNNKYEWKLCSKINELSDKYSNFEANRYYGSRGQAKVNQSKLIIKNQTHHKNKYNKAFNKILILIFIIFLCSFSSLILYSIYAPRIPDNKNYSQNDLMFSYVMKLYDSEEGGFKSSIQNSNLSNRMNTITDTYFSISILKYIDKIYWEKGISLKNKIEPIIFNGTWQNTISIYKKYYPNFLITSEIISRPEYKIILNIYSKINNLNGTDLNLIDSISYILKIPNPLNVSKCVSFIMKSMKIDKSIGETPDSPSNLISTAFGYEMLDFFGINISIYKPFITDYLNIKLGGFLTIPSLFSESNNLWHDRIEIKYWALYIAKVFNDLGMILKGNTDLSNSYIILDKNYYFSENKEFG